MSAIGVMHIAGPVPDIEDLPGLGDGAEQGIVAALSLLPGVEADCRAFGETAGGEHRAVEVQGDAGKPQPGELRQDTPAAEMAQVADATFIQPRQRPAEGGDIRQPPEPEQAQHHGIVPVEAHVLEPTITQQQVDDQQQHHHPVSKDGADLQMVEALAQLSLQVDAGEQRLVEHQTGKRGQALVFEPDFRDAMGLAMDGSFATLHANGLRWFDWLFWQLQSYKLRDRFFHA